jgi:hypothetical protein
MSHMDSGEWRRALYVHGRRDRLLEQLRDLRGGDPEVDHQRADRLLLEYIDDRAVTEAFDAIDKWYA